MEKYLNRIPVFEDPHKGGPGSYPVSIESDIKEWLEDEAAKRNLKTGRFTSKLLRMVMEDEKED